MAPCHSAQQEMSLRDCGTDVTAAELRQTTRTHDQNPRWSCQCGSGKLSVHLCGKPAGCAPYFFARGMKQDFEECDVARNAPHTVVFVSHCGAEYSPRSAVRKSCYSPQSDPPLLLLRPSRSGARPCVRVSP